nr:hypothetical protein [Candidatus Sigynarchaeota archaeon]
NSLDVELAKKPWFLSVDVDPRKILKRNSGEIFTTVTERIGTKTGQLWWLAPAHLASVCRQQGVDAPRPVSVQAIAFLKEMLVKSRELARDELERALIERFRGSQALSNWDLKRILGTVDRTPR